MGAARVRRLLLVAVGLAYAVSIPLGEDHAAHRPFAAIGRRQLLACGAL